MAEEDATWRRLILENVWNGRPISKIVFAEPLDVLDGTPVSSSSSRPFTSASTGWAFERFVHVDDWIPQRLVTATGPNPLPR